MGPTLIYGTAWKKDRTAALTALALEQGFRAIDTACQPKHYHEPGVGEAVCAWLERGNRREDLFLQTKFTPIDGHDERVPYDPRAPIADQVRASFAASLANLGVSYVDSLVLHGPYTPYDLTDDDWEAWTALEAIHANGGCRALGVSNVRLEQLRALVEGAKVRPAWVQNRCFAAAGWDRDVRRYCAAEKIGYQGFSLLTANVAVLRHPETHAIARRAGATIAQLVFAFARAAGMVPLTGTTDPAHMREDLAHGAIALEADDVARLEGLVAR